MKKEIYRINSCNIFCKYLNYKILYYLIVEFKILKGKNQLHFKTIKP